jgi:spermidine/putrescine-binding protein
VTVNHLDYWPGTTAQPILDHLKTTNVNIALQTAPVATYLSAVIGKAAQLDTFENWSIFSVPILNNKPAILQPIPVTQVPNVINMGDVYWEPAKALSGNPNGDGIAGAIMRDVWWPDKYPRALQYVPWEFGIDCLGYNPNFIDINHGTEGNPDLNSWGALVDKQWKGKTMIKDLATEGVNQWANYLVKSNQMSQPPSASQVPFDLSTSDIDKIVNYLVPIKQSGQFKLLWPDYGTSVTTITSSEVWVGDCWAGAAVDIRRANVPFVYFNPKEGGDGWFVGCSISATEPANNLSNIHRFINTSIDPVLATYWGANGYAWSGYASPQLRTTMGPELYDWTFGGKATYKPITGSSNQPDRIAKALFLGEKYQWSKEEGTPDPNGSVNWRGTIDHYINSMGTYETWLTNASYYFQAWAKLKGA